MARWESASRWLIKQALRLREQDGQALAEYSLILAFIAAVCILALGALGLALSNSLDGVIAGFP